jgi:molybdopterin-guanine dinucleotide biosynthesis protein A
VTATLPPHSDHPLLNVGGIVLAGGRSLRMGRPKAELAFGNETVLARIVRIVASAVAPVVVVGQAHQQRPDLPKEVLFVTDEQPHQGPLAGLIAGLELLENRVDAAFVTGCDIPLLSREVIALLIDRMNENAALTGSTNESDSEIVAVDEGSFWQPLLAVYRCSTLRQARILYEAGERSLQQLLRACHTSRVDPEQLRSVDPDLNCLKGMNNESEYRHLLTLAGQFDRT